MMLENSIENSAGSAVQYVLLLHCFQTKVCLENRHRMLQSKQPVCPYENSNNQNLRSEWKSVQIR